MLMIWLVAGLELSLVAIFVLYWDRFVERSAVRVAAGFITMGFVGITPILQAALAKHALEAGSREHSLLAVVATESTLTIVMLYWAAKKKRKP
jgi:hypothetical protein